MGSSKKQTVGYKYSLGMHQILCHGPVDSMSRYTVDDRIAWSGVSTGGNITVSAPSLFGGEAREGGISGNMDLEMGGPDQLSNAYLQSQLGDDIPAFRGVVGVVQKQMYLGNNPYLKKNAWRLTRIHTRQDGIEQWYDEKAAVGVQNSIAPSSLWSYINVGAADNTDYSQADNTAWPVSQAPFGSGTYAAEARLPSGHGFNDVPTTIISIDSKLWYRKDFYFDGDEDVVFECFVDDTFILYVNGVVVYTQNNPANWGYAIVTIPKANIVTGMNNLAIRHTDTNTDLSHNYFDCRFTAQIVDPPDMNPAHIIRECLTDPIWGMGYAEADMDDPSFVKAADTLFAEGMGISLLWDRQMPIEQFVQEIVKHINAALYVGRRGPEAGKFVLKLIRNDYDPETLLHFDENNIEKVEGFKRVEIGELTNSVTVNYVDGATGKTASTTAQDPALVQQQGAVINTTMQYPGFTYHSLADRVALRDLQSLSTPLASCTIYTNTDAKDLNIGDVIAVSWEDYGLIRLPMRITAMTLGDGKSNKIKMVLTQDTFALPEQGVIVPPDIGWEDPSQEPLPIERQYAEELPYFELVQQMSQSVVDTQLATMPDLGIVGAAASRPQTGAINARFETDSGAGFEDVGAIDFSPSGLLAGPVAIDALEIEIESVIDAETIELGTYAKVNDEYLLVEDRVGTTLTVKRGVLDTVPAIHAEGDVIFFSDPFVQADPTEYVASDIVDVALLTVAGQGTLEPSQAVEMQVELGSRAVRPYPPANVKINGELWPLTVDLSLGEPEITFNTRNRLQQTGGEMIGWYEVGDITPETGTSYVVRTYEDATDTLIYEDDASVASPIALPTLAIGPGVTRLEITALRDGYESWQPVIIRFLTANPIEMQNGVGFIQLEDDTFLYAEKL